MTSISPEIIHVLLINEPVDVWRPVLAEKLADFTFLILEQPYDREIESWQFAPGSQVICEQVSSADGGTFLGAMRLANGSHASAE
jgi:hypothetical protein